MNTLAQNPRISSHMNVNQGASLSLDILPNMSFPEVVSGSSANTNQGNSRLSTQFSPHQGSQTLQSPGGTAGNSSVLHKSSSSSNFSTSFFHSILLNSNGGNTASIANFGTGNQTGGSNHTNSVGFPNITSPSNPTPIPVTQPSFPMSTSMDAFSRLSSSAMSSTSLATSTLRSSLSSTTLSNPGATGSAAGNTANLTSPPLTMGLGLNINSLRPIASGSRLSEMLNFSAAINSNTSTTNNNNSASPPATSPGPVGTSVGMGVNAASTSSQTLNMLTLNMNSNSSSSSINHSNSSNFLLSLNSPQIGSQALGNPQAPFSPAISSPGINSVTRDGNPRLPFGSMFKSNSSSNLSSVPSQADLSVLFNNTDFSNPQAVTVVNGSNGSNSGTTSISSIVNPGVATGFNNKRIRRNLTSSMSATFLSGLETMSPRGSLGFSSNNSSMNNISILTTNIPNSGMANTESGAANTVNIGHSTSSNTSTSMVPSAPSSGASSGSLTATKSSLTAPLGFTLQPGNASTGMGAGSAVGTTVGEISTTSPRINNVKREQLPNPTSISMGSSSNQNSGTSGSTTSSATVGTTNSITSSAPGSLRLKIVGSSADDPLDLETVSATTTTALFDFTTPNALGGLNLGSMTNLSGLGGMGNRTLSVSSLGSLSQSASSSNLKALSEFLNMNSSMAAQNNNNHGNGNGSTLGSSNRNDNAPHVHGQENEDQEHLSAHSLSSSTLLGNNQNSINAVSRVPSQVENNGRLKQTPSHANTSSSSRSFSNSQLPPTSGSRSTNSSSSFQLPLTISVSRANSSSNLFQMDSTPGNLSTLPGMNGISGLSNLGSFSNLASLAALQTNGMNVSTPLPLSDTQLQQNQANMQAQLNALSQNQAQNQRGQSSTELGSVVSNQSPNQSHRDVDNDGVTSSGALSMDGMSSIALGGMSSADAFSDTYNSLNNSNNMDLLGNLTSLAALSGLNINNLGIGSLNVGGFNNLNNLNGISLQHAQLLNSLRTAQVSALGDEFNSTNENGMNPTSHPEFLRLLQAQAQSLARVHSQGNGHPGMHFRNPNAFHPYSDGVGSPGSSSAKRSLKETLSSSPSASNLLDLEGREEYSHSASHMGHQSLSHSHPQGHGHGHGMHNAHPLGMGMAIGVPMGIPMGVPMGISMTLPPQIGSSIDEVLAASGLFGSVLHFSPSEVDIAREMNIDGSGGYGAGHENLEDLDEEQRKDAVNGSTIGTQKDTTQTAQPETVVDRHKKRLARKAELARASRRRKKAYVGDLQRRVYVLTSMLLHVERSCNVETGVRRLAPLSSSGGNMQDGEEEEAE